MFNLIRVWECSQCHNIQRFIENREPQCKFCNPPEDLMVSSEEFYNNTQKYLQESNHRTVNVMRNGVTVMSLGGLAPLPIVLPRLDPL